MFGVVTVNHKQKKVNISFQKGILTFPKVREALVETKKYLDKGYQIVVEGYFSGKDYSREVKTFLFALEVLGQEKRILFLNRAKYRKAERRKLRIKAEKLYVKGKKVKEIAQKFGIPEKTVYRWL